MRHGRTAQRALVAVLVLALMLVVPAVGPARSGAHDFISVHSIFPHQHDGHAGHEALDLNEEGAEVADLSFQQPGLSAAGPLGDAASLAGKGLLAAALMAVMAGILLRPVGAVSLRLAPQRWDSVPTGPPR